MQHGPVSCDSLVAAPSGAVAATGLDADEFIAIMPAGWTVRARNGTSVVATRDDAELHDAAYFEHGDITVARFVTASERDAASTG